MHDTPTIAADPDSLYTGVGSSAFIDDEEATLQSKTAKEESKRQREQGSNLLPVANDIFAFIKDEEAAIADIRSYLSQGIKDPADLMAEYRAREIYIGYLKRFQTWMTTRLSKTTVYNHKRK